MADAGYETDTISITSTVSSTKTETYNVKNILSQREDSDDEGIVIKRYLIEWDGYPLDRCTWEPEENLEGTDLVDLWARQKAHMGTVRHERFILQNEAAFDEACDKAEAAKLQRQQKRRRKRERLRRFTQRVVTLSDSDDDVPLLRRRSLGQSRTEKSRDTASNSQINSKKSNDSHVASVEGDLSIKERPVARRRPLEQSSSDSEASQHPVPTEKTVVHDSTSTNGKCGSANKADKDLLVSPRHNSKYGIGTSILSRESADQVSSVTALHSVENKQGSPLTSKKPLQEPAKPHTSPGLQQDAPVNLGQRKDGNLTEIGPPDKVAIRMYESTDRRVSVPNLPATKHSHDENSVTRRDQNVVISRPPTKATTTATTDSEGVPVLSTSLSSIKRTGISTISSTGIKFTNNSQIKHQKGWQNGGRLYSKLRYRGLADKRSHAEGAPDLTALEFVGPAPADIVKLKAQDPVDNPYGRRQTGSRRMHENSNDDDMRRRPSTENITSAQHWESDKVPLVCYHWRYGNECTYSDQRCHFMHRNKDDNGKDYPIGDSSHWIPQKYRRPPLTCIYWLTSSRGCTKPDSECNFAHKNTGFIPKDMNHKDEPVPIDPSTRPVVAESIGKIHNRKSFPRPDRTCLFWQRGYCHFSAEDCAFQHYEIDGVSPVNLPQHHKPSSFTSLQQTPKICDSLTTLPKQIIPSVASDLPRGLVHDVMGDVSKDIAEMNAQDQSIRRPTNDSISQPEILTTAPITIERPMNTFPVADLSCPDLKDKIESALKVKIADLFDTSDNRKEKTKNQRAILLFHPVDHIEELELLTRLLLMHQVEVSCAWNEGCWQFFRQQILENDLGVIIAHPDFESFLDLPGFGQVLQKQVKLWSLGSQEVFEFNSAMSDYHSKLRQVCVEIFPMGGLIYITDDVFAKKPQLALRILKLFLGKIQILCSVNGAVRPLNDMTVPPLVWRLCTRPELMEYLYQKCEDQTTKLEAGDIDVGALAQAYTLLSEADLIEQDHATGAVDLVVDKYPILSERRVVAEERPLDYFNTVSRSQEEANLQMIRYYAAVQVDLRRDYRHFFVVHTDPYADCVKQWKKEIQSIAEVVTPEQCIGELEKTGKESLFDFHERYASGFYVKPGASNENLQPEDEIRAA